ncbi:MAG: hypothetical protein HFG12_06800 [Oscillibacter sp.]|jgi:hypothetical protein|nr:hypothetical protein [uncultured Oscillibacter sp.]MCI8812928.1 hypothetical protein [Oscillibacter sp.]
MAHHDVTLNIHCSAPDELWRRMGAVYQSMPCWAGNARGPRWTGEGIDLWASVEPGGLQIAGEMPEEIWQEWYRRLRAALTDALGYEIGEPADGYEFVYWE